MSLHSSEIAQFYEGRSVFITGATGFVGKVLIEKLLRSCSGIERIYLLMRPSKGKEVASRLQELVLNQVFDSVRGYGALEKLTALEGDVTLAGFGLSEPDLQLLVDHVSVVFNSAASIRFDNDIKSAMEINVKGPRRMMEICKKIKNLKAFVHVSTAFSHLNNEIVQEVIYPPHVDLIKLIDFIDCLDKDLADQITPQLLGVYPNTYNYCKTLAEQMLMEQQCLHGIPLIIVRPSMVTAALREPQPGWIDNFNGPTGLIAGIAKGFIRVVRCNQETICDIIPVDFTTNLMIAAAWHTAKKNPGPIEVYTSATGDKNPLTWKQMNDAIFAWFSRNPPEEMMWYPSAKLIGNNFWFQINMYLLHLLPGYLLDLYQILQGKPRKWVRLYRKVARLMSSLAFFSTRNWKFISNNPIRLMEHMSDQDRGTFYFDVRKIDWNSYLKDYYLGERKYLLKDEPSSLPMARKTLKKLYYLRLLVWLIIISIFLFFVTCFMMPYSISHNQFNKSNLLADYNWDDLFAQNANGTFLDSDIIIPSKYFEPFDEPSKTFYSVI